MELDPRQFIAFFPGVATQLRGSLSTLYLAASQLTPASVREQDASSDTKAAILDQNYYRILRILIHLNLISSLSSGKRKEREALELTDAVEELCEKAESLAALRGVELSFRRPRNRIVCSINREDLELLVYNLLSNALKFTPRGGQITVELRSEGGTAALSVRDTGCGIDREHQEILFDRYLHPELQEPLPYGLGLGLTACRMIAEECGGTILVESQVGKGSVFTVSLPEYRGASVRLTDVPFDYTGGFNTTLLGLADALPAEAFRVRSLD